MCVLELWWSLAEQVASRGHWSHSHIPSPQHMLSHLANSFPSCNPILPQAPITRSGLSLLGAVLVDGQDVGLPWIGAEGFNVSLASSAFLLLRWPGAWVLWGVEDPAAYITLEPHYAYQVCKKASEYPG